MSILHPSILYLSLACALGPLVIHLLTRLRHRRESWAAMQFLVSAHARIRRRLNLRHYLMLVLRTAAILFLGLALSRPGATDAWMLPGDAYSKCARIILLDDTLSMQSHHESSPNSFAVAKSFVEDLLRDFPANAPTALITLSSNRDQSPRFVPNPVDLLTVLQSTEVSFRSGDIAQSLYSAAQLLADTRDTWETSRMYLISDLDHATIKQLSDLGNHPEMIDSVGDLLIANVGPKHRDNIAIEALSRVSEIIAPRLPVRYSVEVANYSPADLSSITLKILCNGELRQDIPIDSIRSGGRATQSFELTFARPGPQRIAVELAGSPSDVLPADSARFLTENIPNQIKILLVEGQAGLPDAQQELFYVRTSLRVVGDPIRPLVHAKSILPQQLDSEVVDDHAIIILGDIPSLSSAAADRLTRFVSHGGGLVVFCGEQTDANVDHMLPVHLDRFETIEESADALSLSIADSNHPAVADIMSHARGGLTAAHVSGRWITRSAEASTGSRTLIKFSDDNAAVILASKGRGRIVAFTTGASMQWSNLPAKPDFVPLMLNLISFAAGGNSDTTSVEIGQPIALAIDSRETSREHMIQRPDSRSAHGSIELHDGRPTMIYTDTDKPGIYSARMKAKRTEFAVNVNTSESDLRTTDITSLIRDSNGRISLMEPKSPVLARASQPDRHELSGVFIILLLVVVMTETFLAKWFGKRT
jgi:hypothetical protein